MKEAAVTKRHIHCRRPQLKSHLNSFVLLVLIHTSKYKPMFFHHIHFIHCTISLLWNISLFAVWSSSPKYNYTLHTTHFPSYFILFLPYTKYSNHKIHKIHTIKREKPTKLSCSSPNSKLPNSRLSSF